MRRVPFAFVLSVFSLAMCVTSFADEVPAVKPYVEEPPAPMVAQTVIPVTPPVIDTPTAAVKPIHVPNLSGDWCGSWQSCKNGHKGPMRATFCRLCNGNYEVTFTGRFCLLIPFRYTTTLNVTGYSDGVVCLSGSENLGPIFGTFSYNAWATDRQFASGYSASKDQGQFFLYR